MNDLRLLEWTTIAIVALIAWWWLRGRRVPKGLALAGALASLFSVVLEGYRPLMLPAFLAIVVALGLAWLQPAATAPPKGGWLRWTGRATLAGAVVLIAVVPPALLPVLRLPAPTGPHPIGTTWIVLVDSTRHERFSTVPGAVRRFPVKLWYPAATGATGARAKYAATDEMTLGGLLPTFIAEQTRLIRTHAMQDVPVAEGHAPVLVFSHGYTGYAAQNTPQMEELASRGYVVASIAHPGEAAYAPFPDGTGMALDTSVTNATTRLIADMKKKGTDPLKQLDSAMKTLAVADRAERQANFRKYLDMTKEPLRRQSLREWSLDTKVLVDALEQMQSGATPSRFAGRLDLAHLGVFGMSYGGATAGEFCRQDARCRAAINLDGGQFGDLVDDSLLVPFLIIGSEQAYGIHVPVLDLVRAPAWLARVPATTHMGLTDMTLLVPVLGRWTGVTGRLAPDRREAIMTDFTVAFFEKYLMGRAPELFDGLAAKYPEVEVTRRNVP